MAAGVVRVADAHGAPPSLPFWLGEAPARSAELSAAVSELRRQLADRLVARAGPTIPTRGALAAWTMPASRRHRAEQIVDLLRGVAADSRRPADRGHDRAREVLRRIGRDATGAACAVRQPCQSRVGAGAAKALLPPVQLRAAGRRVGGRAAAVARPAALVSARRRVSLPAPEHRQGRADSGVSGRAGVSDPLAVERHRVACRAEESRGQEGARAAAADAGRRSAGGGLSRRRGVPGEHPGRPADPGSPAGQPDGARLPRRSDGPAGAPRDPAADPRRNDSVRLPRHARALAALARDPQRAAVRVRRRRAARGAADAGRA